MAGMLSLRLGPEAHWIIVVDDWLQGQGVKDSGFAVGGQAVLSARFVESFALELSYRQSKASISGKGTAADFEDMERFATLRLVGSL